MMRVCSHCGAENNETAHVCRMCSHPLAAINQDGAQAISPQEFASTIITPSHPIVKVECRLCTALNDVSFNFCHKCGTRLVKDELTQDLKAIDAGNISQAPTLPQTDVADPHATTMVTGPMIQCSNCMNEVSTDRRSCNVCGMPLATDSPLAGPAVKALPRFCLRLIVDGEESEEVYQLGDTITIGRIQGDLDFPYDDYMSSMHATITRRGDRFFLTDNGSRNGTLIMIEGEEELKPGAVFMVGRQFFRFGIE